MFLDKVTPKIWVILLTSVITVGGVFAFMWDNVNDKLIQRTSELVEANRSIGELSSDNLTLVAEAERRSEINFNLAIELAKLQADHQQDLDMLQTRIDDLSKERPTATVVIENTKYIKETYVEKATDVVLDSMWGSYCRLQKGCPQ